MSPLLRVRFRCCPRTAVFRRNHRSFTAVFQPGSNLLCPGSTFVVTNSRCFSEAILKSDFVAAVADQLTQNEFVYTVQDKLIAIHEASGLPWWAVIVSSTIAIRALLFPVAVGQQRVLANLRKVYKEMDTIVEPEVTEATKKQAEEKRLDEESMLQSYHNQVFDTRQELYAKYKCKPSKTLTLPLIQVPVWVTMSGALYNINSMLPVRDEVATQTYLDMKASSFAGLADLTAVDDTYLLPLFVVSANLAIVRLKTMAVLDRSNFRDIAYIFWRVLSIGSFTFIMYAPKCMTLYWLTSSLMGVLQNVLFVHPKTRRILRISHTDATNAEPFARWKGRFKSIYYFFKY